jgi:hypothetical protein
VQPAGRERLQGDATLSAALHGTIGDPSMGGKARSMLAISVERGPTVEVDDASALGFSGEDSAARHNKSVGTSKPIRNASLNLLGSADHQKRADVGR